VVTPILKIALGLVLELDPWFQSPFSAIEDEFETISRAGTNTSDIKTHENEHRRKCPGRGKNFQCFGLIFFARLKKSVPEI
jgi:hypothetical protein